VCCSPAGVGVAIGLQPTHRASARAASLSLELDLCRRPACDISAGRESARLIGLGAINLSSFDGQAHWVTFADPEGNEFNLIAN